MNTETSTFSIEVLFLNIFGQNRDETLQTAKVELQNSFMAGVDVHVLESYPGRIFNELKFEAGKLFV